jgi:hypothetical protein
VSVRLFGLDFETTGVDVASCGVVQAACVEWSAWEWSTATADTRNTEVQAEAVLCRPGVPIPLASTLVHGITDSAGAAAARAALGREPTLVTAEHHTFAALAGSLLDTIEAAGGILVTFNGCTFDLPILERHARRKLAARHIDVYRMHQQARAAGTLCEHVAGGWPASIFTASLSAAHVFWTGEVFAGAHDALVDVRATLRTLLAMLEHPDAGWTLDAAFAATTDPLPGDVDFSGKMRWNHEGEAVWSVGKKHAGTRLRDLDRGYMRWVLREDFPDDTKAILQAALRGVYPQPPKTAP